MHIQGDGQFLQKCLIIQIIPVNVLSFIAPGRDMVVCPGILNAELSGHIAFISGFYKISSLKIRPLFSGPLFSGGLSKKILSATRNQPKICLSDRFSKAFKVRPSLDSYMT